jgi:hypothetical protein
MRSNLKRSGTHGKLKNSRIQEFKEFRRQIPMSARINTGSNTSLIGWKPVNHRPYGRPILQLLTSEFLPLAETLIVSKRVEQSIYSCLYIGTMLSEWEIKTRGRQCARTQEAFDDGATIFTLLFRDRGGFRREDISERAWLQIKDSVEPFSFWKSKFHVPLPPAPDPMPKESVEELLRRLLQQDLPEHVNVRYVLAIMLERKKALKQVDTRESAEERILIYEHAKTGEVFIIVDPRLRLDQLDLVQQEVLLLMAPPSTGATAAAPISADLS